MSCPKDSKKAIAVTDEKGGGVLPPNLEKALVRQLRRVEAENPETNELQLKLQELRQEFPQKEQTPNFYVNLFKYLTELEPTDETFQKICVALHSSNVKGEPACPELLAPPIYFMLAMKFKDQLPASWSELRGEGELGQDLRDFETINFCDTILAGQEDSPIERKVKKDLVALATGKAMANWYNLNTIYPFYWLSQDHQTSIAQMLPFLGSCPREINRARQAMKKLEAQDRVELSAKLLLAPDAEEQLAHLEVEQQIRQKRWNEQRSKVLLYQNFCDFLAHYANEEDEVIHACLRNFIKDPQLGNDDKKFYTSCLAMILNNQVEKDD